MLRSMTGFGQGSAQTPIVQVTVLARSVNNRHADIRLRLPESLAAWEGEARRRVAARIRRGRVDVEIRLAFDGGGPEAVRMNRGLAATIVASARDLGRELGIAGEIDLATLLRVPGVLAIASEPTALDEDAQAAVQAALDAAVSGLEAERAREGNVIGTDLAARISIMAEIVTTLAARASDVPSIARRRLVERIEALDPGATLDPARLAQEVAFLADRADITEELVRLRGHLDQARRLVETPDGEPVGRRLDFLVQEILRETNTVASKSADLEISRAAVDLKVETEKVREQVQNLE